MLESKDDQRMQGWKWIAIEPNVKTYSLRLANITKLKDKVVVQHRTFLKLLNQVSHITCYEHCRRLFTVFRCLAGFILSIMSAISQ